MCVYDAIYNQAIADRDKATEEIKMIRAAIEYYTEWQGKIKDCLSFLESAITQNIAIAKECAEIYINGKPIDKGERHYPNGGASLMTSKLRTCKYWMSTFSSEMTKCLNELQEALTLSTKRKTAALKTLQITPVPPCGECTECNPVAPAVTAPEATPAPKPASTPKPPGAVPVALEQ